MYKLRVSNEPGTHILEDKEGFVHDIRMDQSMDDAILTLMGTMFNLYSSFSSNKATLKDALKDLKLVFRPQTDSLKHLVDPEKMFDLLSMLDAQGYPFDNVESDYAITMKTVLNDSRDFTLVDTMVLYWAKLSPELIKRCPRYKTDDKFQFLYEEASKEPVSSPLIVEEILERKDYDVKASLKKNMDLTESDEKIVDYVLEQWDSVRQQLVEDMKKKAAEKND